MTNTHRWGTVETRFATFAIWLDGDGRLVRFHLSAAGAAAVDRDALYDERAIADVRRQVEQYCAGERMTFDIERAARGTDFQHAVWEALMSIPYGETRSYGQIATPLRARIKEHEHVEDLPNQNSADCGGTRTARPRC